VLQPHEGSSETGIVVAPAGRNAGFNPTRVRLKLVMLDEADKFTRSLQPHEGSSETRQANEEIDRLEASTPRGFV